jgi:hypothetical protein
MKLIINARESHLDKGPIAIVIIAEFKQAILSSECGEVDAVSINNYFVRKSYSAWRRLEKYIPKRIKKYWFNKYAQQTKTERHYFNVILGQEWDKCFPYMLFPGKRSVYMFDTWASSHKDIVEYVETYQLCNVFVSASQSAKRLQSMVNRPVFSWIPEGVNPDRYEYRAYVDKNIDVLELGRKYDVYHDHIVNALKDDERVHLYEKTKGKLIFPTEKNLIDGLARTKISICVPSNITHPDRAGDIETMTVRYLQSMASKCLIVGHAPQEMVELFGYNPVIEIDMEKPAEQIRDILENFADYIPLIEKNYAETLANHTWNNRWQQMHEIMQSAD